MITSIPLQDAAAVWPSEQAPKKSTAVLVFLEVQLLDSVRHLFARPRSGIPQRDQCDHVTSHITSHRPHTHTAHAQRGRGPKGPQGPPKDPPMTPPKAAKMNQYLPQVTKPNNHPTVQKRTLKTGLALGNASSDLPPQAKLDTRRAG